jgi:glutathione S-transferase
MKAMKLYYAPLACSLADHIALLEAGVDFESESVDLKTKRTAAGADFTVVSHKGYVPVLVLDSGAVLTENIALLDWIASQHPQLGVGGDLGRTRLLEALTYISTEIHRSFKPFWHDASNAEKARASTTITGQFRLMADSATGLYLFGHSPSVADFYLFVMLLWAERFGVAVPASLLSLRERISQRASTRTAMREEGLI